MTDQNVDDGVISAAIDDAVQRRDTVALMGIAVATLASIANSQAQLLALAKADMEAQVEEESQSRAEALAEEIVADKTKRSFIGKRV